MTPAQKYRQLASELRARADDPAQTDQRTRILELAEHFEACAAAIDRGEPYDVRSK